MGLKSVRIFAAVILASIAVGCAHRPPPTTQPANDPGGSFALRGLDSHILFDFNSHSAAGKRHVLQSDEVCCLFAGDAVLICTLDGSNLLFAPGDGVALVRDNPASRLRPIDRDPDGEQRMQAFSTIVLVASSVDRLPDGLADYLNDPGPHRRQAISLARKIVSDNGAEFPAEAHGGTFSVFMRLTNSGREKLLDALQSDDNDAGIYLVGQDRHRSP
jgi:hypothetical protein